MKKYLYIKPSNVIPVYIIYLLVTIYAFSAGHYIEAGLILFSQMVYHHANEFCFELMWARVYREQVRKAMLSAAKNSADGKGLSTLKIDKDGDIVYEPENT